MLLQESEMGAWHPLWHDPMWPKNNPTVSVSFRVLLWNSMNYLKCPIPTWMRRAGNMTVNYLQSRGDHVPLCSVYEDKGKRAEHKELQGMEEAPEPPVHTGGLSPSYGQRASGPAHPQPQKHLLLGRAAWLLRPFLHAPRTRILKKLNWSFYITALMHQTSTNRTLALQTWTLSSMAALKQWAATLKKNRNRTEKSKTEIHWSYYLRSPLNYFL